MFRAFKESMKVFIISRKIAKDLGGKVLKSNRLWNLLG